MEGGIWLNLVFGMVGIAGAAGLLVAVMSLCAKVTPGSLERAATEMEKEERAKLNLRRALQKAKAAGPFVPFKVEPPQPPRIEPPLHVEKRKETEEELLARIDRQLKQKLGGQTR